MKTLNANCLNALADELAIRQAAAVLGLELRTHRGVSGQGPNATPTLHWQLFRRDNAFLLASYWPGTGTVRCGAHRGEALDAWHFLQWGQDLADGDHPDAVFTRPPLDPAGPEPVKLWRGAA